MYLLRHCSGRKAWALRRQGSDQPRSTRNAWLMTACNLRPETVEVQTPVVLGGWWCVVHGAWLLASEVSLLRDGLPFFSPFCFYSCLQRHGESVSTSPLNADTKKAKSEAEAGKSECYTECSLSAVLASLAFNTKAKRRGDHPLISIY